MVSDPQSALGFIALPLQFRAIRHSFPATMIPQLRITRSHTIARKGGFEGHGLAKDQMIQTAGKRKEHFKDNSIVLSG
jgi:hypothetical protein